MTGDERVDRGDRATRGASVTGEGPATGDDGAVGGQGPAGVPSAAGRDVRFWADVRFWLIAALVVALYFGRILITIAIEGSWTPSQPEFTTVGLFMVPVLLAAFNFGTAGGLAMATWVAILSLPRIASFSGMENYLPAWVGAVELVILAVLGGIVGQRVTAERHARNEAEEAEVAHLAAEARYRGLFESNRAPILLVDPAGTVVEANAAASDAFGTGAPVPAGMTLGELVQGGSSPTAVPARVRVERDGEEVFYRTGVTALAGPDGEPLVQVVFDNVTDETRRHERVEAYAVNVLHGQEEERRHIAQELHDGPLQSLVHLCRQIDQVTKAGGLAGATAAALGECRTMSEAIVTELRAISRGLRPSILDDLGLAASLGRLASELEVRTGVETTFDVLGAGTRIAADAELAVFRIAQEALTNVERHAGARHVRVDLRLDARRAYLKVADDGCGFDVGAALGGTAPMAASGLGLTGMVERARLAGGQLDVTSRPGGGTVVTLDLSSGRAESGRDGTTGLPGDGAGGAHRHQGDGGASPGSGRTSAAASDPVSSVVGPFGDASAPQGA